MGKTAVHVSVLDPSIAMSEIISCWVKWPFVNSIKANLLWMGVLLKMFYPPIITVNYSTGTKKMKFKIIKAYLAWMCIFF